MNRIIDGKLFWSRNQRLHLQVVVPLIVLASLFIANEASAAALCDETYDPDSALLPCSAMVTRADCPTISEALPPPCNKNEENRVGVELVAGYEDGDSPTVAICIPPVRVGEPPIVEGTITLPGQESVEGTFDLGASENSKRIIANYRGECYAVQFPSQDLPSATEPVFGIYVSYPESLGNEFGNPAWLDNFARGAVLVLGSSGEPEKVAGVGVPNRPEVCRMLNNQRECALLSGRDHAQCINRVRKMCSEQNFKAGKSLKDAVN